MTPVQADMVPAMIWRPNVTVAAVVERDRHFLLVEEQTAEGVLINQPAGHLKEGETLEQAVIRETLEETGWHFRPTALLGVYRWQRAAGATTFLRFAFTGELLRHDPDRPLDEGILRTLWLDAQDIARSRDRHRSPQVNRCVRDYLDGRCTPLDVIADLQGSGE